MLYRRLLILVALILCAVGGAYARTYYLPDYQSQFMYGDRTTETPNHSSNRPKCESYGYYSSMPSGYQCSRAPSPIHGMKCYSCTPCSSSYKYDSSSCSGDYVLSGSSCGGLYNKCLCNRSKFPAETDADCPSGQKIDLNQSCTNKSDGKTYYKCVSDPCSSLPSKTECEATGGYCVVSANCSGKCDECIDYCEWKEQQGAIRCDNGCKSGYQIPECSDLCEPGGCKPTTCETGYILSGDECVPNPCSGYMDACPAHAICGDTCQSGEDTKYKPTGCETGYQLNAAGTACESIDCDPGYILVGSECKPNPCDGFNLTACPVHAICQECQSGEDTKYQISGCDVGYELNSAGTACESIACDTGYVLVGSECEPDPCNGYNLTTCPTHATCDECQSGDATKYKPTGCDTGYELNAAGTACEPSACPDGYAVVVSDCGAVTNGVYTLRSDSSNWQSGDQTCKLCVLRCNVGYTPNSDGTACEGCPRGYATKVSDCGVVANGSYYLDLVVEGTSTDSCRKCLVRCNDGYTFDTSSASCEKCPIGYATSTEGCGTVTNGSYWLSLGDTYGGCKRCILECAPGYNPDATGTACEKVGCAAGTATTVEGCGANPPHGTWSLGSGAAGTCRLCVVNCDSGFTQFPPYPNDCTTGGCDACMPENVCEYRAKELGFTMYGEHKFKSGVCSCAVNPDESCVISMGTGCLKLYTTYKGKRFNCTLEAPLSRGICGTVYQPTDGGSLESLASWLSGWNNYKLETSGYNNMTMTGRVCVGP